MYTVPFLDLPPLRSAAGTVRLPGSKSISNRVLLLAGLSAGTTVVHDLLDSDDTQVMLEALRVLGCKLERDGEALHVTGLGGRLATKQAKLFLGNAGTAMRPLTAALALLAATQGGDFELSGVARMHERPIGDLVDALRQLGCAVDCLGTEGYPPLRLHASGQALQAAQPIRVRGDVSSQFLTALLLALPLVAHDGDIAVEVQGELISKPYVEITLNLLARFGIAVRREGWQRFTIPQGSAYRSPGRIHVEGDASSASYFIALGAIAADGEPVRIEGVGTDSIQGDIRFVEAAQAMGAQVASGPGWIEVKRGRWPLQAITLDCNHIPDAAMTLAVMALYATGTTRLSNIASWRVKETDRIAAMAAELRKLGAGVVEGDDFIEVTPPAALRPAAIHTYDDHRIAMCFSLAAFKGVPVRILDPKCVGKTFPDYFEALFDLVRTPVEAVPVLTVDGPTASGKGTLASAVAQALGYHFLDSGAVYRATALSAMRIGVAAGDEASLARIAATLPLHFVGGDAHLGSENVAEALRAEDVGAMASKVSAWPAVREALRQLQLSFRRVPGLVADGRDMGTVIFPGAELKVFLTASAATRAERRYKQLISKGIPANISTLRTDLEARDARDQNRSVAPLKPAQDALLLDNSALTVEASMEQVLTAWEQRRPFG
ncbi:MAG TPA: bifunctional 3-phosphoshikimate 1-carboxyvinyltransferase/cytidylate kinase [Piscinibacter sp.]|jgi:3-phosphoshikimate 1-carboxyvinyltransferase|uniref:bifunctional 3-phosphoshikimate 1-carboxyvinyltransferase/cytidylate kinase n=1 Tax=Piscinibacter sp. TaxID=1903157 RepID=UPI001D4F822E|nr:bifunctional 3-phosphoshikimate 1-carboxyvinyltransferase/cytidylate kinase [Piscinibacter sp.]MBK7533010.1 bifunctional 3-phosphoshikimate 1-carboxyvinyltransferase/cytidylate kinase [Piscinibacter sp.]HOY33909.1 bifunctional 3-phosphoshikimate 1-carboxyvinyltransferase/cytidylate kinase [Piscinibacter sp.]HPM67768.1 bifunctional 3-phosphoshikimate 1-carboxyvinyltransferase/cytidylate kinase [Piscinibacter sp.]